MTAQVRVLLLALTVMWGYSWVVAKVALDYAPPFAFAGMRSLLGALALFAVLRWMRRPLALHSGWRVAVVGLFQTAGLLGLQTLALVEGGAGKTALLIFTMPVWVLPLQSLLLPLGRPEAKAATHGAATEGSAASCGHPLAGQGGRGECSFLLKTRMSMSEVCAALLALAGLGFMLLPGQSFHFASFVGLAAGMCWAAGTLLMKRWQAQIGHDVLWLTAWQMLFGALVLCAVALLLPEAPIQWAPEFIGILVFMVLAVTAWGWYLWLYLLAKLHAWQASLAVLGIPMIALLSSRLQLGEAIPPLEILGIALLMPALGWLAWQKRRGVSA